MYNSYYFFTVILIFCIKPYVLGQEPLSYFVISNLLPNYLELFVQPYQEIPPTLNPDKVKFKLYSRLSPIPQEISYGVQEDLITSHFNYEKQVIFIVHGWTNFPIEIGIPRIFKDTLREKDANVFLVDWTATGFKLENQMLANAPVVGKRIADFIIWLKANGPMQLNTTHLIGFSMGAHLCGIAGRSLTLRKVGRITGLDPPTTSFDPYPERLKKGDADYVEIMHTGTNAFSQKEPSGDADFYPNWGTIMPGCITILCSHVRALEYFEASIGFENGFKAMQCLDYNEILARRCSNLGTAYMGGLNFKNISGVYYLETNGKAPYYKLQF